MMNFKTSKLIYDPIWGLIDITDYLPLIDSEPFQALGFKYQLGVTSLLFPAATHTRKQHSFGAFKRTQGLTERWLKLGFINEKESRLMNTYALWHDIGHGPFSHVVEVITRELWGTSHDLHNETLIQKYQDAVEKADIDFSELKKMFSHENQLYLAIHDKNLGTEKLDYLSRDAYYTLGEKPGVEYLSYHTYFIDGKLCVDEKAIEQAKALQEFYVKMYKHVYLRKNSVIAQRLMQKMASELLSELSIKENDFWSLTDFGLLGQLETSKNNKIRNYYERFMLRDLPKTAVVLRIDEFSKIEQQTDKAQTVIGIAEDKMRALAECKKITMPSLLAVVEEKIADMAELPKGSVIIAPPSGADRFKTQDIYIYIPKTNKIAKLSDYFADHFKAIKEEERSYATLRICVFDEYRQKLSEPKMARKAGDYLLSLIKT